MFSVDLVSDNAAFASLDSEWNDAVDRAGIVHPFLRHEWVSAWWDAFGGGGREELHLIVVRDATRAICAIAPLMSDRWPMYGVPVRRLRLLQNDHTPRTGVIVAAHAEDSYRAIWHALHDGRKRWDVLQLSQLPDSSETRAHFMRLAAEEGIHTGIWESGASPYLRLDSSWTAYVEDLDSKFKRNLRNRLSHASKLGELRLEVVDEPSMLRASFADVQRLEDSGWKASEGTAIASDSRVRSFYSLVTERAANAGWLRMLFLEVGGRRVAAAYAALYANRLFLIKTGYDPSFAKCAPFKLLTSFAVRYAYEHGIDEIDFLGDVEPWKLEWTSTARRHDWLFVFAATARGRLLHPVKFQLVPAVRQLCSSQTSRA